jgi:hypothetical protein
MDADITSLIRNERRREKFPVDAACAHCGESDRRALVLGSEPLRCYSCSGQRTETHHLAGRSNASVTIPLPANEHRLASDLQQNWPKSMLRNPSSSPLVAMAASMQGWCDVLALIIERGVGWIPAALVALDAALTEKLGERWWTLDAFMVFRVQLPAGVVGRG